MVARSFNPRGLLQAGLLALAMTSTSAMAMRAPALPHAPEPEPAVDPAPVCANPGEDLFAATLTRPDLVSDFGIKCVNPSAPGGGYVPVEVMASAISHTAQMAPPAEQGFMPPLRLFIPGGDPGPSFVTFAVSPRSDIISGSSCRTFDFQAISGIVGGPMSNPDATGDFTICQRPAASARAPKPASP